MQEVKTIYDNSRLISVRFTLPSTIPIFLSDLLCIFFSHIFASYICFTLNLLPSVPKGETERISKLINEFGSRS